VSSACSLTSVELFTADDGFLPSFVSISETSSISVLPASLEEIGTFSLKAILYF